jgi:glycosyltransferase involved in cell wall biosynthesis
LKQILIDISSITDTLRRNQPPHGIPRVTLAYLQYYLYDMQVLFRTRTRVFIFPQDISQEIGLLLLSWEPTYFRTIARLIIKGFLRSHKTTIRNNCFLLKTDLGGFKNPGYIKTLNDRNIRLLAIVHDLIPAKNPEYYSRSEQEKFSQDISTIINHAKGIVAVSETTRTDLVKHVSLMKRECPPMVTAPLASGLRPVLTQEKLINEPYFLVIGTIDPRKNHLLLLQIWRNLVDKLGVKTPKLVIIGKRSKKCWGSLDMLDRCEQLKGVVIESQSPDQELINYLLHARALLFPTFSEGYGLPLIEALSFSTPVIASNLPVFREIAGNIPDYLDPLDGKGWMEHIENYALEDSSLRQAQKQRMTNFHIPSWNDHFSKVDAFMNILERSK